MRISFVLSGYPWKPNGAFRVVYEYSNQLVSRGHQVTVVHVRELLDKSLTPPKNSPIWFRAKACAIRDTLFKPRVNWQPIDSRVSLRYVSRLNSHSIPDGDAVFATAWDTVADVLALPDRKGDKFYLVQSYDTWSGNQERVDATWRAPLHKVVVSRWLYANGLRLGCDDMAYIPNGINHSRYCLHAPLSHRSRRVAMRYSTLAFRGAAEALAALQIVRQDHPELEVVFFGATSAKSLPRWIKYYKIPPQEYLIKQIYNGSSIFLLASHSESFSLPAAEAMACGCALVSTDCGGVGEFAEHGRTALLSPPRNSDLLATNLLQVLDDDSLRLRLATAGMERVRNLTWDRSAAGLEAFIRGWLATAKKPPHPAEESRLELRA